MLNVEISISQGVACTGDALQKSSKYRITIECQAPALAFGLERSKSDYAKINGPRLHWNRPFGSSFTLASDIDNEEYVLVLSLRQSHLIGHGEDIGASVLLLNNLETTWEDRSAEVFLKKNNDEIAAKLVVNLKLSPCRPSTLVANPLLNPNSSLPSLIEDRELPHALTHDPLTEMDVDASTPGLGEIVQQAARWERLTRRLELALRVGDRVAELNSIAKLAWGVVSIAFKALSDQVQRDLKISTLVEAMSDACSFADEATPLSNYSHSQAMVINKILQQIIQCAYFIKAYCRHQSFGKRLISNITAEVDRQISEYTDNFQQLQRSLQASSTIQTRVVVFKLFEEASSTNEKIDEIDTGRILEDLTYARDSRRDMHRGCLPGTREDVIYTILAWAAQADTPPSPSTIRISPLSVESHLSSSNNSGARILWICGLSGSGKSAVARTVAAKLEELGRLGSFYAFDHTLPVTLNPSTLFSTVTRDLADRDSVWRQKLVSAIRGKTNLRTTPNVTEQFEAFILTPGSAMSSATIGDVVIVIDAFDESENASKRSELLSILTDRAIEIPEGIKIIITSRYEDDVRKAFKRRPLNVDVFLLDNVLLASTRSDINTFVQHTLGQVDELSEHNSEVMLLVEKAGTSFQWASTACQYILAMDDGDGAGPNERLTWVLAGDAGFDKLDKLYKLILDRFFRNARPHTMSRLATILGLILYSVEPLPLRSLIALAVSNNEPTEVDMKEYARLACTLGSLLTGVHDFDTPVRTLHASFHDFTCDRTRGGRYFINKSEVVQRLPLQCFDVMTRPNGLRFNICDFPSSFVRNQDVPDFSKRVSNRVSPTIAYACKYWASHGDLWDGWTLKSLEALEEQVLVFMGSRFTQWLEVMSAIQSPPLVPLVKMKQLVDAHMNKLGSDSDKWTPYNLQSRLSDAIQFVSTFNHAIMASIPHIYISAVPFWASERPIEDQWVTYVNYHQVKGRKAVPSTQPMILEGHSRTIRALACGRQAQGKVLIASASDYDSVIILWDLSTGVQVGHHQLLSDASCLGFSIDGKLLFAGLKDGTIFVWDVVSNPDAKRTLAGHDDSVHSISVSPQGNVFASSSNDSTIRLWSIESLEQTTVLKGHTGWVTSVAFSPKGNQLVSASTMDNTIKIWDVASGNVLASYNSDWPRCAAWSPDSTYIIVGTSDGEIKKYDATDLPLASDSERAPVLIGSHEGRVNGMVLLDSQTLETQDHMLVTVSDDQTIQCHSMPSRSSPAYKLTGHTDGINAIAAVPSCSDLHIGRVCFATGSADRTVRVWPENIFNGPSTRPTTEKHDGGVLAVLYSKDGRFILTYGQDRRILIWNAANGALVGKMSGVHTDAVSGMDFAPDGSQIATCGDCEAIHLWSIIGLDQPSQSPPSEILEFLPTGLSISGHPGQARSVKFSPNGTHLVSGCRDGSVGLWDIRNYEQASTSPKHQSATLHEDEVTVVVFAGCTNRFVSVSWDKTWALWEINTNTTELRAISERSPTNGLIRDAVCSQDGAQLLTAGDQGIAVWSIRQQTILFILEGSGEKAARSLALSTDGNYAVSGGRDSIIRLWDLRDKRQLGSGLKGHTKRIRGVAFSPDGNQVVSGSKDGSVCVWDVQLGQYANNRQTKPSFTPERPPLLDYHHYLSQLFSSFTLKSGDDGWIKGLDGKILMWVPHEYRGALSHWGMRQLDNQIRVEIDFSEETFKCGERWTECRP